MDNLSYNQQEDGGENAAYLYDFSQPRDVATGEREL